MNKFFFLPLNPFGIENPVAGAIARIVIGRGTILWLRLALALDFVVFDVVVIVHVMIGRWFFVVVDDAIRRRGCIRGRASGPYIVCVVVMGRITMKVIFVGEHRHELFVVEPIEVVVFDAACDGWSFEERDGIAD